MSLLFLPHNVAHALVGGMFGMSADTSENTYYEVIPVLREVCPSQRWDAEKAWKKGEPPWHPDFETPLRRPSIGERQRQVYSGKRKRHTIKYPGGHR